MKLKPKLIIEFPSITAFLLSRLTGVAKVVIREIMTMLEECRGSLSENYGANEKRERLVTVFTWGAARMLWYTVFFA